MCIRDSKKATRTRRSKKAAEAAPAAVEVPATEAPKAEDCLLYTSWCKRLYRSRIYIFKSVGKSIG